MEGRKVKRSRTIFFKKLAAFVRNSKFTPTERLVLVDLLLYAGAYGDAFPSQETLGQDMGRSTRQIRSILVKLISEEIIGVLNSKLYKSNLYDLEEFYLYNFSDEKSTSSDIGNTFPNTGGNSLPNNGTHYINENKINVFQNHLNFFKPIPPFCSNCEQGLIFSNNEVNLCKCQTEKIQ